MCVCFNSLTGVLLYIWCMGIDKMETGDIHMLWQVSKTLLSLTNGKLEIRVCYIHRCETSLY